MTIHWSTCKVHKRSAPNFEGSPYPGQPPAPHSLLCTARAAPFNLTVISHLAAVAVVRVGFFFFSSKGRGRLGERDRGFSFLLHERDDTGSRGESRAMGGVPWARPPPPARLCPTCCAAHQRLLLGFQKKATKGKSEPARFPSNQRSRFQPGGFRHRRARPTSWTRLKENSLAIGPLPDSPRFFPSRAASDFETWNLNGSAVLFPRQVGCSCPASR